MDRVRLRWWWPAGSWATGAVLGWAARLMRRVLPEGCPHEGNSDPAVCRFAEVWEWFALVCRSHRTGSGDPTAWPLALAPCRCSPPSPRRLRRERCPWCWRGPWLRGSVAQMDALRPSPCAAAACCRGCFSVAAPRGTACEDCCVAPRCGLIPAALLASPPNGRDNFSGVIAGKT